MIISPFEISIVEGETVVYSGKLVGEDGAPVPAAALSGARLTYYSVGSGKIVNGRANQNILNANGVTIAVDGTLTWKLAEADVRMVDHPLQQNATHRAVFVFEWLDSQGVARQAVREVDVHIQRVSYGPFDAP
ncbi:MAG: hypothetical protein NZ578_08495 [Candidatus Binatia bacterium]|nr:hypothetical protein [Candidatus Binatia bacterium]